MTSNGFSSQASSSVRPTLRRRLYHLLLSIVVSVLKPLIIRPAYPYAGRKTDIWICVSTMHILMAASRPVREGTPIFVFYTDIHNQSDFASALGLPCAKLGLVPLFREIWKGLITLRKVRIFAPHVSTHIMSPRQFKCFQMLRAQDRITYYDDGFSSLSRRTHLFRDDFIPQGALIHTWSYAYLLDRRHNDRIAPIAPLEGLIQLTARAPWLEGLKAGQPESALMPLSPSAGAESLLPPIKPDSRPSTTCILSSKSLHSSAAWQASQQRPMEHRTYYIPHYKDSKNDPALVAAMENIIPAQVELFLLSFSRYADVELLFGVTSSVILLMELVLASPHMHHLHLVSCIDTTAIKATDTDEYMDFMKALNWYQNHPRLRAKGVSMATMHV